MKKSLLTRSAVAVVAVAGLVGVTGCSSSSSGPDDEVTLTVWNPQDNWRKTTSYYEDKLAEFEEKHPNVTIEYVDIPYGQYEARYTAGFTSGKDAPDIFMGQVSYYAGGLGVADEAPDDLQKLWSDNLTPLTARNFQLDGSWYGYPVSSDLGMQLYYNMDQFTEVGLDPAQPPTTFDELQEYAEKLAIQDPSGKVTRNGMALRYSGNPTGIVDKALPYIHAFGGRLYAEDQSTADGYLNSDETVAGIQYMQDLVNDGVSSLELGSPDDTFAQGLSSMTFREGWYEGWLTQNAPDVNFGVVPYPEGPEGYPQVSLLFNWAWMVNSQSPDAEIAWDWMRAVSDPELDLGLAELEGYLPVWTENFDTPYVTERNDYQAVEKQIEEGAGPVYNAPYTNQIATVVGAAIEKALQGGDVREALDGAVAEVDELLERGR
ncbi:extracellular solute-binding protein [Microbacterium hydrocarbonoxydans]|uniref:extracellular solute-binding protein n=1 Tax=Microbacterium hydrocarbonoxydans TaxID=273678 RepID=UPI0007BB31EC|nr:extracellular solute-binding protein [Microbacterium hydrocarbonoxydans]GAT74265.1 ABC transporter, substrate binding protein [Microbacterium sp. HM58-2]